MQHQIRRGCPATVSTLTLSSASTGWACGTAERPALGALRTPGLGVPVRVHHTSKSLECAALISRTVAALQVPSSAWALSIAVSSLSSSLSTLATLDSCGVNAGVLAGVAGDCTLSSSKLASSNAARNSVHFSRLFHCLTVSYGTPYFRDTLARVHRPRTKSRRAFRRVARDGRGRVTCGVSAGGLLGGISAAEIMPDLSPRSLPRSSPFSVLLRIVCGRQFWHVLGTVAITLR